LGCNGTSEVNDPGGHETEKIGSTKKELLTEDAGGGKKPERKGSVVTLHKRMGLEKLEFTGEFWQPKGGDKLRSLREDNCAMGVAKSGGGQKRHRKLLPENKWVFAGLKARHVGEKSGNVEKTTSESTKGGNSEIHREC